MAKEIRWSLKANKDRQEILNYWTNRNKSARYSIELDQLFRNSINLLSEAAGGTRKALNCNYYAVGTGTPHYSSNIGLAFGW